ncbi:type II secretion system F family protein [Zhihengliuella salsuginis]|uniref:Type II secretion system protein F n=1 Tax=Zhihengliuella salsuginis TaxID=578222 RepID=A0ABQ3GJ36_9MICC|nr:type II secretion system F family protein [Zhihengliuella salsuginis]GHD08818.1 type II secretion system protein F [Zhihengliuella salsuginis]
MSLLLGLTLGMGLFLVWRSAWVVPATPNTARTSSRVERLILRSGIQNLSQRGFITASIICGVVCAFVVLLATTAPIMAVLFGSFGSAIPWAVLRWRAAKRAAALREQWPEVVDHLRSAIRAGLPLPDALAQLSTQGPSDLQLHFREFALDYRASGRFNDAAERLRYRLADPVADKIITALRITREVGGSDLGQMLATLSTFLRESARTRGELEARQSWTVNAARLAVGAPWAILLLLSMQPQAVAAYSTWTGAGVLLGGLLVSLICYRVMLRIGSLPEEERVIK